MLDFALFWVGEPRRTRFCKPIEKFKCFVFQVEKFPKVVATYQGREIPQNNKTIKLI